LFVLEVVVEAYFLRVDERWELKWRIFDFMGRSTFFLFERLLIFSDNGWIN